MPETQRLAKPDVIVTQLEGSDGRPESLLLHLTTQHYFSLNPTGTSILNALERVLLLATVATERTQAFDATTPDHAETSMLHLANELIDAIFATSPDEAA